MKRIVILACALVLAPLVSAQLYKYTDQNGKTVYTDQPPPEADTKQMRIPSSATGGAAPAGKTYVQQDKELQKGRDKLKEGDKKSDEKEVRARADLERCQSAKSAYEHYAAGGRIAKYDEKGERVFLGDAEIDAERARAKAKMDEVCKT
jgi:hypothetical protein